VSGPRRSSVRLPAGVFITGRAARALTILISKALPDQLQAVPADLRDEVLAVFFALRALLDDAPASVSGGSAEGGQTEADASSPHDHDDEITAAEAGRMLGVTDRRARQLAELHGIGRKVGGRWTFARSAVIDLVQERQEGAA
jgi:hypothetical protein